MKATEGMPSGIGILKGDSPSGIWFYCTVGGIGYKQQQKNKTEQITPPWGNFFIDPVIKGQQQADESRSSRSEDQSSQKTDSSVDVQRMTAVVPPPDSPSHFQKITGKIFQNGTQNHGKKKYEQGFFPERTEEKTQKQTSGSVYGKVRPSVYSPVNKGMIRNIKKQNFPDPSCKGQRKK